jgi:hypothetical protein
MGFGMHEEKKFELRGNHSSSEATFAPFSIAFWTCSATICRCIAETRGPTVVAGSIPSPT